MDSVLIIVTIAILILAIVIFFFNKNRKKKFGKNRKKRQKYRTNYDKVEISDRASGSQQNNEFTNSYFNDPLLDDEISHNDKTDPLFNKNIESTSKLEITKLEPKTTNLETNLDKNIEAETNFEQQINNEITSNEITSNETADFETTHTKEQLETQEEDDNQYIEEEASELIIVLYVISQDEIGFSGDSVLTTLEDIGLKYGKKRIFHHYGVGELKSQKSVYSIANMVEPGVLDPGLLTATYYTQGLALFMCLPGPFGGRVAFELMLNNANRISELLEGSVKDETGNTIEQNKIMEIRNKIAHFERRSTNLSMLRNRHQ